MRYLRNAILWALPLVVMSVAWAQAPAPATTSARSKSSASKMPTARAKSTPAPATSGSGLVDINHASVEALKALPGVGDAYAAKIVAGRPYKMKTQLKSRKILPDAVYSRINDQIVATQ